MKAFKKHANVKSYVNSIFLSLQKNLFYWTESFHFHSPTQYENRYIPCFISDSS